MANERAESLSIGDWLRGRRAERRLRQDELAKILQVSERLYRRWEANDPNYQPTDLTHLRAISEWSGVPVADLEPMVPRKAG